jgi:hypothetical protein
MSVTRRTLTGPEHPRYRTGMSHDVFGYRTLSSMVHGADYGRREHQVVAEKMLGRPLASGEVVHHINGVRDDNRPANLAVMTRAEHVRVHHARGRFIGCRVCGAPRWHSPAAEARVGVKGYACRACGGRWAP